MGWRMKNFNILGVHRKIWVLGGLHEKIIYGGDWTVCGFKGRGGGLTMKKGGCFWVGWYPNAYYVFYVEECR